MIDRRSLFAAALAGLAAPSPALSQAQEGSRDAAFNAMVDKLFTQTSEAHEGKAIFASKEVVPAGQAVPLAWGTLAGQDTTAWLFFIDDDVLAEWSHPVRYVYVNPRTHELRVVRDGRAPRYDDFDQLAAGEVREADKLFDFSFASPVGDAASRVFPIEEKYAVIISGGGNKYMNHERYWNGCAATYQTLVRVYGYLPENIYVLMADGTDPAADQRLSNGAYVSSNPDLDGDGDADIQYDASRASVAQVFDTLAQRLTQRSHLYVYVTDHGIADADGNASMVLWRGETMSASEFAVQIDKANTAQMVIALTQCYSGGFVNKLIKPLRTIVTAARADEVARVRPGGRYSEFTYQWTAALSGVLPDGMKVKADANNDSSVSIYEALEYVRKADQSGESPQYGSHPYIIGLTDTL